MSLVNACELVIADSLGTNKLPGKKVLLQALQNLFAEEISLQSFTMSLVREKIQSDPILCKESPKKSIGQDPCGMALQFPNSLAG